MRILGPGHGLFAIAAAGLAILSLVYRDFAPIWQPLPAWIPLRETWVYAGALLVLAASAGLCFSRTALPSVWAIGAYLAAWAVTSEIALTLLLAASAWIVATSLRNRPWGFASA